MKFLEIQSKSGMFLFGIIKNKMLKTFKKSLFWLWWTVLILVALILIFWLFQKNLVPNGYLKIKKTFTSETSLFKKQTNFISDFYPKGRISEIALDKDKNYFQKIFTEPIYFKINLPRSNFNKIKIKMFYKIKNQKIIQLAMMQQNNLGVGEWKFKINPAKIFKEDNLNILETQYQITPEFIKDNQLEFMISAPNLADNRGEIDIYRIETELYGERINSFSDIKKIGLDILHKIFNKITNKPKF